MGVRRRMRAWIDDGLVTTVDRFGVTTRCRPVWRDLNPDEGGAGLGVAFCAWGGGARASRGAIERVCAYLCVCLCVKYPFGFAWSALRFNFQFLGSALGLHFSSSLGLHRVFTFAWGLRG